MMMMTTTTTWWHDDHNHRHCRNHDHCDRGESQNLIAVRRKASSADASKILSPSLRTFVGCHMTSGYLSGMTVAGGYRRRQTHWLHSTLGFVLRRQRASVGTLNGCGRSWAWPHDPGVMLLPIAFWSRCRDEPHVIPTDHWQARLTCCFPSFPVASGQSCSSIRRLCLRSRQHCIPMALSLHNVFFQIFCWKQRNTSKYHEIIWNTMKYIEIPLVTNHEIPLCRSMQIMHISPFQETAVALSRARFSTMEALAVPLGESMASPGLHQCFTIFSTGVLTHNHMKPLKLSETHINIIDHIIDHLIWSIDIVTIFDIEDISDI